jgi:hypothetical protein
LAAEREVDRAWLAVFGHSEGGVYALLLASGLAGPAPTVRAVGLFEPVPVRRRCASMMSSLDTRLDRIASASSNALSWFR